MLFSLLKHHLDLNITDSALKVYCFTTSISYGAETISPGCGLRASLMLYFLQDVSYLLYFSYNCTNIDANKNMVYINYGCMYV